MFIKIGTDICSIKRIEDSYARFGSRFARRILTDSEQEYVFHNSKHSGPRFAARFAAKEAMSKALGTGWRGIDWKEVEVINKRSGEPSIHLHGRAARLAETLGLEKIEVSLSHEREFATAFVVAYGKEKQS